MQNMGQKEPLMQEPAQSRARAALFALAGYGVFSGHDAIIKSLGGTYSVIQIVFFSSLFTFPLIALLLVHDAEPGTLRPKNTGLVALRSVSGSVAAFTAFYAFTVLPLAQVYAILFATPLLITLLAIPFLGETVRLRRRLAVVAGLVGVIALLVLIAMTCVLFAYRQGPAIIVAPMQYSQIIWAVFFGTLFFGEEPDLITFLGTAIIVASGLYILRREGDPSVSRNTPVLRTRTRAGLPAGLRVGTLLRRSQNND